MKSSEFIIEKTNALVIQFPSIKVMYFIDSFEDANYLKVLPPQTFSESMSFKKAQAQILIDFATQYPYDELVFLTEGSSIDLENPIYSKTGASYSKECNKVNFIEFNELLKEMQKIVYNDYNLKSTIRNVKENSFFSNSITESEVKEYCLEDFFLEINEIQVGESDYAMAA